MDEKDKLVPRWTKRVPHRKFSKGPKWTKRLHNKKFPKSLKGQKDTPKQIAAKYKQNVLTKLKEYEER